MFTHFFEIPVYRLNQQKYQSEEDVYHRYLYKHFNLKESQKPYKEFVNHQLRYFGRIWRYNEIIGYIRLYFAGNQIRGEYYQHNVQRIRKTKCKNFTYKTHKLAVEINIDNKTNMQIFQSILDYLFECDKELKNRYIDTEYINLVGPFIQWNELLENQKTLL